jgi:SsrA-binding protein
MAKSEQGIKIVATNRKARFRFHIEDTVEAGLELVGAEVKSLRGGGCSLDESYARPAGREIFVYDMHIPPYAQATVDRPDPVRRRKALLHRSEIDRVIARCTQRGYTLVPLKVYFREGWAKVELALCRGKTGEDKRARERQKEKRQEIQSAMDRRGR